MKASGYGLGFSQIKLGIILLVGLLFSGMSSAQNSYYTSYEIIIPKQLTLKGRENPEGRLSYVLLMKEKRQVIHLKPKRGLFVKNFPVYTYSKGVPTLDIPLIPDNCHYDGHVEGEQGSLVSISTCSGLKGIMTMQKTVFGIEPIESSKKFEHILYRMDQYPRGSCRLTTKEGQSFRSSVENQRKEEKEKLESEALPYVWSHTKYVEMFVVVDNNRFQMWNSNVTKTAQMVMDALAHVNTYSQGLKVKVVLVGLEIWTEKDQVRIPVDLREVLHNFNHWRNQKLFRRAKHDVAHLIVGHDPGMYAGEAFLNGACVAKFAAGVESFNHEDIVHFAVLMVHELGHNLGITHDHLDCMCPDQPFCIMHESTTVESSFSNCSLDNFYEFLRHRGGSCLYDKPVPREVPRKPICGDHVVDKGEECDCGTDQDCKKDQCCLPSCQLRKGSDCAFGPCCRKCKFLKAATLCRPSVDECDLPEYCNGTSRWCQPNTYKQDGTPCKSQSYCYQGQCRSLESQCVEVFGEGSRAARKSCYRHVNTQGDRFGNCGSAQNGLDKVFAKCDPENIMCGRLLCEDIPRLPQTKNHHTIIQIPLEDTWCWGLDLFEEVDLPDGGTVKAGTWCGPQKICINQTCLDVQMLQSECKSEATCHGRGVCNNLKHCHCDYGYSPPTCASKGFGGSVDSGPPQEVSADTQKVTEPFLNNIGPISKAKYLLLSAVHPILPTESPDADVDSSLPPNATMVPLDVNPLPVTSNSLLSLDSTDSFDSTSSASDESLTPPDSSFPPSEDLTPSPEGSSPPTSVSPSLPDFNLVPQAIGKPPPDESYLFSSDMPGDTTASIADNTPLSPTPLTPGIEDNNFLLDRDISPGEAVSPPPARNIPFRSQPCSVLPVLLDKRQRNILMLSGLATNGSFFLIAVILVTMIIIWQKKYWIAKMKEREEEKENEEEEKNDGYNQEQDTPT